MIRLLLLYICLIIPIDLQNLKSYTESIDGGMSVEQGFHKDASQKALDDTALPQLDTPEESIPRSLVPWNLDDDRSRYLGLRSSGFTIREALGLIAKAKSTLSKWRKDPVFLDLENRLPELRKELAMEYASVEFLRNYRLVLEKDHRVLKASLKDETHTIDGKEFTTPMSSQDFAYLKVMRAHYTPQQLQAINSLFGPSGGNGSGENWVEMALKLSRTVTEEVMVETRHRQQPELATIKEATDA